MRDISKLSLGARISLRKWKAGITQGCPLHPYSDSRRRYVWLRIQDHHIKLSNGHDCSLTGARYIAKLARKYYLSGESDFVYPDNYPSIYQSDGNNIYRGIAFRDDGSITLGCTSVTWSEICWLALKMGWWKTEPKRKKKICQIKS